jgi:hypothetical protein
MKILNEKKERLEAKNKYGERNQDAERCEKWKQKRKKRKRGNENSYRKE